MSLHVLSLQIISLRWVKSLFKRALIHPLVPQTADRSLRETGKDDYKLPTVSISSLVIKYTWRGTAPVLPDFRYIKLPNVPFLVSLGRPAVLHIKPGSAAKSSDSGRVQGNNKTDIPYYNTRQVSISRHSGHPLKISNDSGLIQVLKNWLLLPQTKGSNCQRNVISSRVRTTNSPEPGYFIATTSPEAGVQFSVETRSSILAPPFIRIFGTKKFMV
jgi:hypothetical protein